jgi:hypothetical protein
VAPLDAQPNERVRASRPRDIPRVVGAAIVVWHAGTEALDQLEPLVGELRRVPGLVERSRGVFYRRSRAFLDFHEDERGLDADVRVGEEFERLAVTSPEEQGRLLALVGAP